MAPIHARQRPSTPAIPRPSPGESAKPIPGTKYISLRIMLELLAGTLCIFIIGVFFWKMGRFIRSFSKKKVLREGNTPTDRYARTWYGWVPMHKHERHKVIFRKGVAKILDWITWDNPKKDYRWVWWDPAQREGECDKESPLLHRWWPKAFGGWSLAAPDTTGNPAKHNSTSPTSARRQPSALMGEVFSLTDILRPGALVLSSLSETYTHDSERVSEFIMSTTLQKCRQGPWQFQGSYAGDHILSRRNRAMFRSLCQFTYHPSKRTNVLNLTNFGSPLGRNRSLPCLSAPYYLSAKLPPGPESSTTTRSSLGQTGLRNPIESLRYSRKYQIWSARMNLMTLGCGQPNMPGIRAPPGSPRSELLYSFSSHQSTLAHMASRTLGSHRRGSSTSSKGGCMSCGIRRHHRDLTTIHSPSFCTCVPKQQPTSSRVRSRSPYNQPQNYRFQKPHATFSQTRQPHIPSSGLNTRRENMSIDRHKSHGDSKGETDYIRRLQLIRVPLRLFNDWELRSVDDLDRRLEWISNQLSPGRRPYHFAMLANHWMNRETWIVYDPPSRVPIEARRKLGDPRFNRPYLMPDGIRKPKYPQVARTVVDSPRLQSWRIAVNRQRKAAGLHDSIKCLELFEDSADEVRDGTVDPASWVLRKPPQGIGLSQKQANAYYEGGTGWQETLDDWQQVRRGYRIRKAIHEGRVNRTRAKEVICGISGRANGRDPDHVPEFS